MAEPSQATKAPLFPISVTSMMPNNCWTARSRLNNLPGFTFCSSTHQIELHTASKNHRKCTCRTHLDKPGHVCAAEQAFIHNSRRRGRNMADTKLWREVKWYVLANPQHHSPESWGKRGEPSERAQTGRCRQCRGAAAGTPPPGGAAGTPLPSSSSAGSAPSCWRGMNTCGDAVHVLWAQVATPVSYPCAQFTYITRLLNEMR